MPVLIANMFPKPDEFDTVEAAFRDFIDLVHKEDGCELYALNRGKDRLILVEKWRDMDALRAHGAGQNLRQLTEKLEGLLTSEIDVQVLTPIPGGDDAKGTI